MKILKSLKYLLLATIVMLSPTVFFIWESSPKHNVVVVYNIKTWRPLMVVVDANDLSDPSFNPSNTKQFPIPSAIFEKYGPSGSVHYYEHHREENQ